MEANIKQAPVGYFGEVVLTINDKRGFPVKKIKIENNGVNNLFMLFCEFLNGSLTSGENSLSVLQALRNRLPKFLSIGSPINVAPTSIAMQALQDSSEMGLVERFQLVSNGTWGIDSKGQIYTQFSCNIPHTSVGNAEIKELGLNASERSGTNDLLARIVLTTGLNPGMVLEDGQSLLVNWQIYFSNKIINNEED